MDEGTDRRAECIEFFVYGGQLIVFERDEIAPTVLAAQGEDGPIGEQAVEQKDETETREAPFQALGQAVKRLEFAVLFGDVFPGVLDELAQDAEGKPISPKFQSRTECKSYPAFGIALYSNAGLLGTRVLYVRFRPSNPKT
jgi:hypothetical protein